MFKKKFQIITLMAILLVGGVMTSQAQDTKDDNPIHRETVNDTNTTREGGDDAPDSILWDLDGGHVPDDADVPDCIIWDIDGATIAVTDNSRANGGGDDIDVPDTIIWDLDGGN